MRRPQNMKKQLFLLSGVKTSGRRFQKSSEKLNFNNNLLVMSIINSWLLLLATFLIKIFEEFGISFNLPVKNH